MLYYGKTIFREAVDEEFVFLPIAELTPFFSSGKDA